MPLPRGATPSPRNLLASATPYRPLMGALGAIPDTFGVVPATLTMLGNGTYGDCVSAEEGEAKNAYSTYYGSGTPLVPTDSEVIAFARKHGILNGAVISDVLDLMASAGMTIGSQTYKDGPKLSVDWTSDATLRAAIYQGPVKIGVASSQLEDAMNAADGIAYGFSHDGNLDHCVALQGYGGMGPLCALHGVPLPSSIPATTPGYFLYTWGRVLIIDRQSMLNITGEAWLRTPTTVGHVPDPPGPTPPGPTPSDSISYFDHSNKVFFMPDDWTRAPNP